MAISRKQFLQKAAFFTLAQVAFAKAIEQLTAQSIFSSPIASGAGQTNFPRYVFIFMDGGIRSFDYLDPLGHPSHAAARTSGLSLAGEMAYNDTSCGGFSAMEKADLYGDYDASGTAPVLRQNVDGGVDLGAAAGGFASIMSDTRIFRGVETSIEHSTASQLSWCGRAFAATPRPTIDCLLAGLVYAQSSADVVEKMFFPHLIFGRSNYVPASIPQEAMQFPVPPGRKGQDYGRFFGSFLDAPFAYGTQATLPLRTAIHEFVDGKNKALQQAVQNSANRIFIDELARLEQARRRIYSNDIISNLVAGVDNYLQSDRYKNTPTGHAIAQLAKNSVVDIEVLQAQLGLVRHCLRNGYTSVATLNIGNTVFDCHGGYGPTAGWAAYRQVSHAIASFVRALKDDGLLESTTVVFFSEMARDPFTGANHHPWATWAISGGRIGTSSGTPRVYGGTEANFDGAKIDPQTGAVVPAASKDAKSLTPTDLLALLLEDAGMAPNGRDLETLLGIKQAPAFLRKIIA